MCGTPGDRIPDRAEVHDGRPNIYPLWVFILWMVLIPEYGSARKVEEAFEDSRHGPWTTIRTAAARELAGWPA